MDEGWRKINHRAFNGSFSKGCGMCSEGNYFFQRLFICYVYVFQLSQWWLQCWMVMQFLLGYQNLVCGVPN